MATLLSDYENVLRKSQQLEATFANLQNEKIDFEKKLQIEAELRSKEDEISRLKEIISRENEKETLTLRELERSRFQISQLTQQNEKSQKLRMEDVEKMSLLREKLCDVTQKQETVMSQMSTQLDNFHVRFENISTHLKKVFFI